MKLATFRVQQFALLVASVALVVAAVHFLYIYSPRAEKQSLADVDIGGNSPTAAENIVQCLEIGIQTAISLAHRRPLDLRFIDESFDQLKMVASKIKTRNSHRTNELMTRKVPEMNSSSWRLHSPSGRNFSHEQLLISGSDGLLVPNVAHFVLPFDNLHLQFHHLVCILSCVWIMKPRLLYLWYVRQLPVGPNWELLQRNLSEAGFWGSRVVLAQRQAPSSVYGLPVRKYEHQSDVMRLEAVLSFGGAYFDLDVITLRPLEPLRLFSFTIGRQSRDGLCNGAFLAAPNSTFLAMWHLAYQTFDSSSWSPHSVNLPHHLCSAAAFQHLCHVEQESMDRPTWNKYERDWIYERPRKWDWRAKNYVMHLWYRFHKPQYNMTSIGKVDSMLGDMFRYVLLGNSSCIC